MWQKDVTEEEIFIGSDFAFDWDRAVMRSPVGMETSKGEKSFLSRDERRA